MEHFTSTRETNRLAAEVTERLYNLTGGKPVDPEKQKRGMELAAKINAAEGEEQLKLMQELKDLFDPNKKEEEPIPDEMDANDEFVPEEEVDDDQKNAENNPAEKILPSGTRVIEGDAGDFAGKGLPIGETLVIEGNTENYAGMEMSGSLRIKGNTGDGVGYRMRDGILLVDKNAGEYSGSDMKGGTLNIEGEVKGFSFYAFHPANKGTVKWKDRTLWRDGKWTPEGKHMMDNNSIPISE